MQKTIVATHNKIVVSSLPDCVFKHPLPVKAKYDCQIPAAGYAWGEVCQYHFELFKCQLGLGKGQELILEKKGGD